MARSKPKKGGKAGKSAEAEPAKGKGKGKGKTGKASTAAGEGKKADKKAKKKGTAKLAPKPVKTGKGASPAEVGDEFVSLFNSGAIGEIENRLWSPKVVSVEGGNVSMGWHGRKAVRAKNDEWMATHTIHSARAEGPFVGASGFAVTFRMDVEDSSTGRRNGMQEIGVYTVERGKIVREEFMYGP